MHARSDRSPRAAAPQHRQTGQVTCGPYCKGARATPDHVRGVLGHREARARRPERRAKACETARAARSRGLRMREAGWRGRGWANAPFYVVLADPAPRTGGGDRPPLRVQRRESLSSGAVGHAGATAGAISHSCPIARRRARRPPRPFSPKLVADGLLVREIMRLELQAGPLEPQDRARSPAGRRWVC